MISKIFKLKFTLTLFLAIFLVNYVSANEEKIINVTLQTTVGTIHIELYSEKAPISVANFLRYADDGYFNNTSFYRAVRYENDNGSPKIEVIQGGIGDGERAYPMIRHESTNISGLKHLDGTLSMSRGAVDTATSDFFICIGDQSGLDYGASRNSDGLGFAAFGRVTSGMDIVRKIHQMPSDKLTDNSYVKGQLINNPIIIKTIQRD
ncbi:MAG: peptidylprolyl isomerase [Woeseiaceae bacterium]|nr:peptidylprolyl isomerase [Woeseiaceae bacterium]